MTIGGLKVSAVIKTVRIRVSTSSGNWTHIKAQFFLYNGHYFIDFSEFIGKVLLLKFISNSIYAKPIS